MFSKEVHSKIFLVGTILLVIGLPVSRFVLSVATLLVVLNWFLEGGFRMKMQTLIRRKSILLFISIYIIHILWLFNTANIDYALHDIRIKMPLFAFPVIYGTSRAFTKKEFRAILQFFIASVFVATLISTYVLLGLSNIELIDPRHASLFISHIRFALMIVLCIYICFYFVTFDSDIRSTPNKYLYYIGIVWFVYFILLLKSLTGVIIFLAIPPIIVYWKLNQSMSKKTLRYSAIVLLILFVGLALYSIYAINRFNKIPNTYPDPYETHTVNGNLYQHTNSRTDKENGHLVWVYISDYELKKEWGRFSTFPYNGVDRKGQSMHVTLLRYMTSMGLKKDSVGLTQLSAKDIDMIENGYTNHIYKYNFSPYPMLYQLLWELEQYKSSGDPSGRSVSQRIEYVKTGWRIFKRHIWFGTGTGDIDNEFKTQYQLDNTLLKPKWQHRTHNQYLTFLITFGIFGFLWVMLAFFASPMLEGRYLNYYFLIFFCIGMLSMLNEDTLETHIGVSFFSFFYAFFLFSQSTKSTDT